MEACHTGTLVFGDLDDPDSPVSKILASTATETPHPEYGIGEKVRFIGLHKNFVAGTVILGDIDECAMGLTVVLEGGGEKKTVTTDRFGDFEFEGLPDGMEYAVTVSAPGRGDRRLEVKTTTSIYLGEIVL